jgi:hypothetical protein
VPDWLLTLMVLVAYVPLVLTPAVFVGYGAHALWNKLRR